MTSSPDPSLPSELRGLLDTASARLTYDYDQWFTAEQVNEVLVDSYRQLKRTASVTTFLPVLAERLSRERLEARAQADGKIVKRIPEILFVCVHNSGRSQLAAALTRHYAGSEAHVRTGGSAPGGQVQPEVVHALKERGLSVGEDFPKPLTQEVVGAADVVITMGCGDSCPYVPGRRYEDWPIADPAGQDTDTVAAIRDDIETRIRTLLTDVLPHLTFPDPT